MADERAVYLVAVAERGALGVLREPGLEPGLVTRVSGVGGLDAMVMDVPAEMFTGEAAEARLKDVAWVAPRAEAHERLVRAAMARATVMPVGFGSVFSGEAALSLALIENIGAIRGYFDLAEGAAEWSVRATCDRVAALRRAETESGAAPGHGAGAAYLRSRSRRADQVAEERAREAIDAFVDDLHETFRDVVERPVLAEEGPRWTLSHLAFLVGEDARGRFDERLEVAARGLEGHGIDLDVSGPWAPYSFCPRLGDEAEEGAAA